MPAMIATINWKKSDRYNGFFFLCTVAVDGVGAGSSGMRSPFEK